MNTLQKTLVAITAGSLLSVSAQAAIHGGTGQAYVGAKAGKYIPNEKGVDSSVSYGIVGGYKFDPNFGVEAEYLRTGKGDIEINGTKIAEYTGNSFGLYGTYDYAFDGSPLYAKGRLGIAKHTIDVTEKLSGQNNSADRSNTNLAGGVGIGYNVTPNVSVEGMYNFYPKVEADNANDTEVRGLTLGANIKF